MDRRNDYKTALLIDAAIHTPADAEATPSPARELAGMGVPFETAKRVLMRPAERRQPLPTAAEAAAASREADLLN
jgi:hypothetical protein